MLVLVNSMYSNNSVQLLYNIHACLFSTTTVPSHIQVLHWRVIQDRLKRFVKLCGNLVLQLLQRLVLKANATLLVLVKRSIKQAVSEVQVQDEEFRRMREQVVSNPFTQGILDRQDMSLDDDDNEEKEGISHLGLVTLQAKSFTSFLPSAELGQCWLNHHYCKVPCMFMYLLQLLCNC